MQNERQRRMAMLKAAMPYAAPESRHAIELLLQADTLINLASHPPAAELSAADIDEDDGGAMRANPEEMLMHIREFCTPIENDMLQTLLNFMHAGRLFQKYRQFAHSHPDMAMAGTDAPNNSSPLSTLLGLINGLGALDSGLRSSNGKANNYMMEFLMSQLSPEQRETFSQLQNIMQPE